MLSSVRASVEPVVTQPPSSAPRWNAGRSVHALRLAGIRVPLESTAADWPRIIARRRGLTRFNRTRPPTSHLPLAGRAVAGDDKTFGGGSMIANFEMTLSWAELIKRTFRKVMADDAQGLASQLAYYFFLALFPALLGVLAIASFFPLQHFTDDVVRTLGPFAPAEMIQIIQQEMAKIAEGNKGGLLTVGFVGALWSSSSAMVA